MSGIIGLYSKNRESVADEAVFGTISLQHRAAEDGGAGISYDLGTEFGAIRNRGVRASDLIGLDELKKIREVGSRSAIGHNLYESTQSLQPTFAWNETNAISFAMDGTLLGFNAKSDAVLKTMFSGYLDMRRKGYGSEDFNSSIFNASERLMNYLDGRGSYNAVILVRGNDDVRLATLRDPKGIKPLCIGKISKNGKYVVASETKALDMLEADFIKDVEPGEAIVIDSKGMHSSGVLKEDKHAHCAFEWFYFADPVSTIEGRNVYLVRKKLGNFLARRYGHEHGEILIVSPDSGRGSWIGYQQELFRMNAEKILRDVDGMNTPAAIKAYLIENLYKAFVPVEEAVTKNTGAPRTYQIEDAELRAFLTKLKFFVNPHVVVDKDADVNEDSIVRGGVLKRGMIDKMKSVGAKRVRGVISCPPLKYPCIKDPKGTDFAAQGIEGPIEEVGKKVAAKIGVDDVCYPTIEECKAAIGLDDVCLACFSGEYPINEEFL